ncbi:hypothetical protein [Geobacter sp.]|uniref:hypothetical protein n=1 Tax=Geobacter sp. TaxID=46610 RepID=UPI001AC6458A|nr:hypothetical protein [Geobacter sp.]CAG1771952.1 hypothetical protein BAC3_02211 [uncultured bacterium]
MRTKKISVVLALLILSGCTCNDNFSGYRYNPFQFNYSEYQLKAEVAQIPSPSLSEANGSPIEFYGLSTILPHQWKTLAESKTIGEDRVVFKSGGNIVMIFREKEKLLGCGYSEFKEGNKDFCSAFESTDDFYWKLYTLTPEQISKEKSGQKWIVHKKGHFFEDIERIKIYKGQGVTVYRSDFKPDSRLKTELIIFHKNLQPDYLIISTTINDEEVIRALIASSEKAQP